MPVAEPRPNGNLLRHGRRMYAASMFMVCLVSLALLGYVGIGEAYRTYTGFQLDKLSAQAETVQGVIETHLRTGLPLGQFAGFTPLTAQILHSDSAIAGFVAFDHDNRPIFTNGRQPIVAVEGTAVAGSDRYEAWQTDELLQVVVPLRDRFENVGKLAIAMPRATIGERISPYMPWFAGAALLLSLGFALVSARHFSRPHADRLREQRTGFLVVFVAMTLAVVTTLVPLYSEGAQVKAKALADSLGERIGAIVKRGIDLADIEGLDRTFADYLALDPDISAIGLLSAGEVLIHTEDDAVGKPWQRTDGAFEYTVALGPGNAAGKEIAVALPATVVHAAILGNVRNFAVLFLASALVAAVFLNLANTFAQPRADDSARKNAAELERVKPILFLAVFTDNLSASFLPQLIRTATDAAQLPAALTSLAFVTYFVCFAAALLPAGRFAQRRGAKPLIRAGALLVAAGTLLLAISEQFLAVGAARMLAGFGQGMLFIGVQSHLLACAPPQLRPRANAIVVYTFNGGMIAGMAIGSLLVLYMGASGVFFLGAAIMLATAAYVASLTNTPAAAPAGDGSLPGIRRMLKAMADRDFLQAMFLVGVPSKAVLTGVVIFALPIVLSEADFSHEEIGQIIMFYALGVLAANFWVARQDDGQRTAERHLFGGMILSAAGLLSIGAIGLLDAAWLDAWPATLSAVLLLGVAAVGIAHGLINAPVMTHVAASRFAVRVGPTQAAATYRFMERLGHIAGPMIAGQLLALGGHSLSVIGWIGAVLLILAMFFQFARRRAGRLLADAR